MDDFDKLLDLVEVDVRPWGGYERLAHNVTCTVKIVRVDPGHRLSLQQHGHRHEFWTILDVPLVVELDGVKREYQPGDKVWVPQGTVHRIGNPGTVPGRFLEIAFGDFDEGDIVRLEDDYQRGTTPPTTNPDRHYAAPARRLDE